MKEQTRNRYKTVREYLRDPESREQILIQASRRLNIREGVPDLERELEKLELLPGDPEESLVMFTGFTTNSNDALMPAGTVYRTSDVTGLELEIGEWDVLSPHRSEDHPSDMAWRFLRGAASERIRQLAALEEKLPPPVVWAQIRDPLGIWVNSARSAAFVITWMFPGKKSDYALVPALNEPLDAQALPTAEDLYTAISRYKTLLKAAPAFRISRLLDRIEEKGDTV